MTSLDVYQTLLRDSIPSEAFIEDVLVYMLVVHTHQICLVAGMSLADVEMPASLAQIRLAPLTRTLVAELVAKLYSGESTRGRKDFWFTEYATRTPYETLADAPSEIRYRALDAKRRLESHPLVEKLTED